MHMATRDEPKPGPERIHETSAIILGTYRRLMSASSGARCSPGGVVVAHYLAIWKFLATHRGYYCEECLAEQLNLSADDVRRSLRHRADVALRYTICQRCLSEKSVLGLRRSA